MYRIAQIFLFLFVVCGYNFSEAQVSPYPKRLPGTGRNYSELLQSCELLDKQCSEIEILKVGDTDAGMPLHLLIYDSEKMFKPVLLEKRTKPVLFVLNGIHPGEPDGIDASIEWIEMFISDKSYTNLLKQITLVFIPVYNVDGMLERGCCSRANQNGPTEYGFRGNGRNLDLNRDFMKTDSRNAITLVRILHQWNPDVFIDTHVSNGADYPYTMTILSSLPARQVRSVREFNELKFTPELYENMKKSGFPSVPYMYTLRETPDSGIVAFDDSPRYSSGYMSLFQTISVLSETHMLKPYEQRVAATKSFLDNVFRITVKFKSEILKRRLEAVQLVKNEKYVPISFKTDYSRFSELSFSRYKAEYKNVDFGSGERLAYNREVQDSVKIRYYQSVYCTDSIKKPVAYVIPYAWNEICNFLEYRGIQCVKLERDTVLKVAADYITDYRTTSYPYEGHYLHYNIKTRTVELTRKFKRGDVLVYTGSSSDRYLVNSLEARALDSFFAWGYFDSVLQQKEHYSAYVFEDTATKLFQNDKSLREDFERKFRSDSLFAKDRSLQLDYVYKRSQYYENTAYLYPVMRIP